ncbi:hypothetical protein QE375_001622 [Microbacterium foliorum]|uniref:HNH endonuclease n=1 Tax=Microbacterium foliorum TaxID=104336 RepID=A0ABU1HPW3_9MICO|nr:hypothetical protein [Microbacterium foliorum]MDR6142068.1 hypothetical protein [Microbacterium foliorum]
MGDTTPKKVLVKLDERDATHGRACVMTGTQTDRIVPQHRQGGAGGRKNKHRLENLLWLDSIINGWIEDHADWAAHAQAWGIKVPLWVTDVAAVPVYFAAELTWYVLEADGRREIPPIVALDMMLEVYGDDYLLWKSVADGTARAHALYLRSAG